MPDDDSASVSSPESHRSQTKPASAMPKSKAKKPSKARLTADQKNTNHKDAENKRRNAIREQFTMLSKLVPGAEGQERSENVMLTKVAEYMKTQLEERKRLIERMEASGRIVPEHLRLNDTDWGGKAWSPKNVDEYEQGRKKRAASGNSKEEEDDDP